MCEFYGITPEVVKTFQASTNRPEAMYMVHAGKPKGLHELKNLAVDIYGEIQKSRFGGKVLIFCITKDLCNQIASDLGDMDRVYHAGLDSDPKKNEQEQ